MISYALLSGLFCLYCYWLYAKYHRVWKPIAKFQGPFAWPLFGNIPQLGLKPETHFNALLGWMRTYKGLFRLYAGPQPYVVLSNPRTVEFLLSSPSLTYKMDMYDFLHPWLGQGLLTSNGSHWVKHRKMITPSFHFQILQDFFYIINETTSRFMLLLDKYAKTQELMDCQDIVTRSTLDIICETALGTRINTIEGESSPLVRAINDLCSVMVGRIFSAAKRSDILFKCTSLYRLQQRSLKIMSSDVSKIINERRKILSNNLKHKDDDEFIRPKMAFLDNLLTAEIDGKPLSFQDIFEEVCTFVFEGHDTTASALAFTIFCLSRHPEVQQKAFQEQVELLGKDANKDPTYNDLQEMKYLELVIKESLRLFPAVPYIGRTMEKEAELDGYIVPKGTTMLVSIIGLGTDEKIFSDPYKFQPERFETDEREHAEPFGYVPFSAGPRNCIGQKFAMMEMKVTISKIVRHFKILPAADGLGSGLYDPNDPKMKRNKTYDPRLIINITLKSINGVYVRLKRRE